MRATAPLADPTVPAIETYLDGRSSGPVFITRTGQRMDEPAAWRLVRRLSGRAGLATASQLDPHALRHAFVTASLGQTSRCTASRTRPGMRIPHHPAS